MTQITRIAARPILDAHGQPALEVIVGLGNWVQGRERRPAGTRARRLTLGVGPLAGPVVAFRTLGHAGRRSRPVLPLFRRSQGCREPRRGTAPACR